MSRSGWDCDKVIFVVWTQERVASSKHLKPGHSVVASLLVITGSKS